MDPIISFRDVSFSYHSNIQVLKSISFSVNPGEAVVILGENGSGKSTLFLNLLHLVPGHSGAIFVKGLEVNHKNEKKIRQKTGLIFQNSNDQLFLPTVKEEIAFGPWNLGLRGKELKNCINQAAAAINIQNIMEKKVFHLSQGEKRKFAIAAVYAMNPDIFLFDEPFANLDPKTKEDLIRILDNLHHQGKTLLLISHEVDQIPEFFKRGIVLHSGKKIFDGSIRELYKSPKILTQANLRLPLVATLYSRIQELYPHLFKKFDFKPPITGQEFETILLEILGEVSDLE